MLLPIIKGLFPFKLKRTIKEHLGVPSLHWSLLHLKKKNFVPAVIIDIGAYEGLWTLDALEVFPGAMVLMVEAQKSKESFLKSIKSKLHNIDYAIELLSAEDGVVKSFSENETASHVLGNEQSDAQATKIATRSLDTLLEMKEFPLPDFLKLDVQGHEMEVLKGAEKSLANATVCLLEISFLDLGSDTPLLTEMIAFMDKRGFQVYDISQLIRRPFDKALFQADMFFVKKDSFLIADKNW